MIKILNKIIALLISVGLYKASDAQLYIESTAFRTDSNALVFVDGDVTYAGSSQQTADHQGLLEIRGNWYNNAVSDKRVFTDASMGTVLLNGGLQTFNGHNTRFPNLTLAGNNLKRQFITIEIKDTLNLTDRELDVNGYTATELWNDVAAINYAGGGYVNTSANNKGWLVRNQTAGTAYVYPLGNNNNGVFRFRPLVITAQNAGNIYGQFQNYMADRDNYLLSLKESSLNEINKLWYHSITTDAAANNNVSVQLAYSTIEDGNFATMAQWNLTAGKWLKLPSTGPVMDNSFNTTDDYFKTATANIIISNTKPTPVSLSTINGFKIPNVITPNGDGYNDKWFIQGVPANGVMEVVI